MLLIHYQHLRTLGEYQDILNEIIEEFILKSNDIKDDEEIEKTEITEESNNFTNEDLKILVERLKSELILTKEENKKLKKQNSKILNNYFSIYNDAPPNLMIHYLYIQSKILNNQVITDSLEELEKKLESKKKE